MAKENQAIDLTIAYITSISQYVIKLLARIKYGYYLTGKCFEISKVSYRQPSDCAKQKKYIVDNQVFEIFSKQGGGG